MARDGVAGGGLLDGGHSVPGFAGAFRLRLPGMSVSNDAVGAGDLIPGRVQREFIR